MSTVCPNCFRDGYRGRCAHCAYVGLEQAGNHLMLEPGTVLQNRYLLGRALGAGGFGITYLAKDRQGDTLCAIKEYLPATLAVRDSDSRSVRPSGNDRDIFQHGLDVFRKEAQVLSRFAGNNAVVQVLDSFQENGTAYFAMEYLDGVNLKALARSMGGRLPVEYAMEILGTIARTLQDVHEQGLLHRDVSPENIFITKQGGIKLIDFGATRLYVGEHSRSLSVILKPGFAPPEQYSSKGNQGPWTDLYALCATMYSVLAGRPVPDAPERLSGAKIEPLNSVRPDVSPALWAALEQGLHLDYRQRTRSVADLLCQAATGDAAAAPAHLPTPAPAAGATPYLQLFREGTGGDKWVIPTGMPMSIGRSSDRCHIVLDDPGVSRLHCTVVYDGKSGIFQLTDKSSNGTFVNGERIENGRTRVLEPGGAFLLAGNLEIRVGVE